jgi:hypothetical protein
MNDSRELPIKKIKPHIILRVGLPLAGILLFFHSPLFAVSYTWVGGTGTAWSTNANWSPATGFPSAAADIAIFNAGANACQLDASRSISNIQISNGYSGNFDFNGYTLTLNSPASNITFDLGNPGTFNLTGAGPGAKIIVIFAANIGFVPPARALTLPNISVQNISAGNNRSITQTINELICGNLTILAGPTKRTTYTANKLAFNAASLTLDGGWFTGGAAGHDTIGGDVTITANGGTLTAPTNAATGWFMVGGNFTMNGGTLTATTGNIVVANNWNMASAGAAATITSGKIYVGGNWNITAGVFTCGTGTVTFNGNGVSNTITTNANNFYILNLNSAGGTGVWTAASPIQTTNLLTLTTGTLAMSTYALTCGAGITATGGTLDATTSNVAVTGAVTFGATSTCTFKAPDASHTFSITTNFAKSAGTFTHNNGTLSLNGTVGGYITTNNYTDFYNIAITNTDSTAINSSIKFNNLTMSANGKFCIASAKADTITGTFSATTGKLQFIGASSLAFANDANLTSITAVTTTTTANLVFYGGSLQKLTQPTAAVTLPIISHPGAAMLQFQNAITSYGLNQSGSGALDFNGKNLTLTSGNLSVTNGTSTTLANMGGITIKATAGNASFNGTSTSTHLVMDGTSNWYIDVPTTKTLTASNCDIGHSYIDATYTNGTATLSTDLGTNGGTAPKWNFLSADTWVGTTSTSFKLAGNWSLGHPPQPGEDAVFNNAATKNCLLDTNITIRNLTFSPTFVRNFSFGSTANVITIAGSTADFSMGAAATITLGTGSLTFTSAAGQNIIPAPLSSQALPNITVTSGTSFPLSVVTNGLYCGNLTLTASAIVFSSSGTTNQFAGISATGSSTMDFGFSNMIKTNSTPVDFSNIALTSDASDSFDFSGSSTQVFKSGGTSNVFPNIKHSGAATLQFASNNVKSVSFTQTGGAGCGLDLGGKNITTTGDFTINNGNTGSFTPATTLNGNSITVGGNASLNGTSLGTYLDMDAATATWTLKVTGTCNATYAHVAYCNASGTQGTAYFSQDLSTIGTNTNWIFYVNWISGSASTWGTPGSWSGGQVPTPLCVVTIDGSGGGTGNCQLSGSPTVLALTMTNGYAGTLDFNNQSLTIAQGADFTTGGAITPTGGSIIFNSGADNSSYLFIPDSGMSIPTLTKSGSSTITTTNYPITVTSAFTLNAGTWSWGTGLTHTVPSIASTGGTMNFGSSNVRVLSSDVNFSSLSSVTNTAGSLVFLKSSNQTLTSSSSLTLPKIYVSGQGKLTLGGNLKCAGLTITMSQFDFSSYSLTVTSDAFRVAGGTPSTFANLGGKSIVVTGDASFSGTPGSLINLNAAAWNIAVSGSLSASYATIANSDANGAARGKALFGCVNGNGNTNWDFSQFQPIWQKTGLGTISAGISTEAGATYLSSNGSPDSLYCINSTDGSTMWVFATANSGTISQPDYYYDGATYDVTVTSGNKLIVLKDNGAMYTQLSFSPITLSGASGGDPFVTPDYSAICVTSTGHIAKYNASTGGAIFNVASANISNGADLVVFSDAIYDATTQGQVEKRDYATGAYIANWTVPTGAGTASIDYPFDIMDNVAYANTSDSRLYAVDLSNLSGTKWFYGLPGPVTAPMFTSPNAQGAWVSAGEYLLKISDQGTSTPTVLWQYDAGAGVNVTGGPVVIQRSAGPVYFGTDAGSFLAVNDGTGANYNVSNWPFASGGTTVLSPWVDPFTWKVIFATVDGILDALPIDY